MGLTHFDEHGKAVMVDVTGKNDTVREATAAGKITVSQEVYDAVEQGRIGKGDVLGVATTAGIMGAKRTAELIPMCHSLRLTGVDIRFALEPDAVHIQAEVKCRGETGVEMEALTAVSAAALTVYDMCKAVQRDMEILDLRLCRKTGGRSGEYIKEW